MTLDRVAQDGLILLGCGKMGSALLAGWLKAGLPPSSVWVIEPNPTDWLIGLGTRLNEGLPSSAAVALLAVKPQMMGSALPALQALGNGTTLFVSIAAGTRIASFEAALGEATPIVRTMPNTPALIGQGVTGLFADASVDETARRDAEQILSAAGTTLWLDKESQVDAVTAISGSGPAYVFYFIEALEAAAIEQGFTADAARRLAMQTFAGSVALAERSQESVSTLRQQVTSKGGTTEAALRVFAEREIAASIGLGVNAAADRGRELGEAMGHD